MKRNTPIPFVLFALCFAGIPRACEAGIVALNELSYGILISDNSDTEEDGGGSSVEDMTNGSGPIDSGVFERYVLGETTLVATSRVIASYTSLNAGAEAFLRFDGDRSLGGAVEFEARSIDQFSPNSIGLDGQNGTARFTYSFDGSLSSADPGSSGAVTLTLSSGFGSYEESLEISALGQFDEMVVLDVPITFGTSFNFSADINGSVAYPDTVDGSDGDSSIVDVLNSATLESIILLDSGGSAVEGTVSSDSGTDYSPFLMIPEPSGTVLVLLAAVGLVFVRNREKLASPSFSKGDRC